TSIVKDQCCDTCGREPVGERVEAVAACPRQSMSHDNDRSRTPIGCSRVEACCACITARGERQFFATHAHWICPSNGLLMFHVPFEASNNELGRHPRHSHFNNRHPPLVPSDGVGADPRK